MQTSTDLAPFFEMEQWDRAAFEQLVRTAFVRGESCEEFKSQLRRLEQRAGGDGKTAAAKVGLCHQLLGRHGSAAEWLEKARGSAFSDFQLARSLRELGRFDDALAALDRARQGGWDELECACEQAETLVHKGETDAAMAIVSEHEQHGASSAVWHYARGRVREAIGEVEGAIADYQRAIELDPNNGRFLFRLAYLLDLHGDEEYAVGLYTEAASLPIVHAQALMNLAVLLEDAGQYDRATACLRRVLSTDPNHARARLFLRDVEASKTMIIDEDQEREARRRDAVLDIAITEFELSVRARNCLKKMNINTLGDLLRISEAELLAYKNFGETSLNEIKAMLSTKGLKLGQLADTSRAKPDPRHGVTGNPEVLARPVAELELSVRSRKCLQRLNINTIGELCSRTEQELLATRNFGQTSLNEIKRRLTELDLRLRKPGE